MILIVDDDPAMRDIMATLVHSFGQEYALADNGRTAVRMLQEKYYTIVLSDIKMPEMDGMELLAHIRENYPEIDVIVITGFGEYYDYTDVINAGASDFIRKPFRGNELQAKIDRIIREQQIIGELRELTKTLERQLNEKEKDLETVHRNLQDAHTRINQLQNQMIVSKYGSAQHRFKPYGMNRK